ncbi:hypothetical protein AJ79_06388 [Helicocarpus griseus UAMH5409]|uniref:Crh-like protein n=1 Tax=Helicocarpus griseus UAMH5409 TaxID=1447875 RepID=A0A2B7XD92_9EURO|nr:hypothetical protein AJ79_06388 [Helicocarpus griseus UAMH5409]
MKLSASVAAMAMSLGSGLVAAQTFSDCNPMEQSCPPNPALGGHATFDFKSASERFDVVGTAPTYGPDGASMTVAKQGDAPTLVSKFYIMFGHVDFVIKAAPGTGIVSSALLQSDTLDEIDWEWLGGRVNQVQTNYFGKNQQGTFDRGQFHQDPGAHSDYHKYSIDWTVDRIEWRINDQVIRTLNAAEAGQQGTSYPQTPMAIRAGVWAGGDPSNPPGTIEWAGGQTDYSAGPFVMGLKSIDVTDYSTGKEYRFTDRSGNWQSIEAVGGQVNGKGTPGSGAQVESSIPPAEKTRPPTTKGMPHGPSGFPRNPSSTLNTGSEPSITSFAGLPSDWIVTDSGRATPPSTASKTSQSTSQSSSPSSPVSSSAGGPESSSNTQAPTITSSGFVTSATGTTPSGTVAPGTGSANPDFRVPYAVAAICGLLGAVAVSL